MPISFGSGNLSAKIYRRMFRNRGIEMPGVVCNARKCGEWRLGHRAEDGLNKFLQSHGTPFSLQKLTATIAKAKSVLVGRVQCDMMIQELLNGHFPVLPS